MNVGVLACLQLSELAREGMTSTASSVHNVFKKILPVACQPVMWQTCSNVELMHETPEHHHLYVMGTSMLSGGIAFHLVYNFPQVAALSQSAHKDSVESGQKQA